MDTIGRSNHRLAVDWLAWASHRAGVALTLVLAQALGWYLKRQSRHQLGGLDDRALSDIGLSRADVAREIDKPFWR